MATMNSARSRRSAGSSAPTAFLQPSGGLAAGLGERGGAGVVAGTGGGGLLLERDEALGAGFQRGEVGGHAGGERGEIGDRDVVLAGGGAEREQALLGALQLLRVEGGGGDGGIQRALGLFEGGQGAVDGRDGAIEQAAGRGGLPLQPAHEAGERGHRRGRAGDGVVGLDHIGGDLLGAHHGGAAGGELFFLVGLWRQRGQLVHRRAQVAGFGLGGGDARLERGDGLIGGAPGGVEGADLAGGFAQAVEGVEQGAVGAGFDQGAVIVLAVDLDQRAADLAEQRGGDRLVVDEGAAAAIGALHTAQDQVALRIEAAVAEEPAGGVVIRHGEDGGDVALPHAGADQRGIAARAQREGERIQQDRLAGAGLAGEHRHSRPEVHAQPVDDDDVADGEGDQHPGGPGASPCRARRTACSATSPCSRAG